MAIPTFRGTWRSGWRRLFRTRAFAFGSIFNSSMTRGRPNNGPPASMSGHVQFRNRHDTAPSEHRMDASDTPSLTDQFAAEMDRLGPFEPRPRLMVAVSGGAG